MPVEFPPLLDLLSGETLTLEYKADLDAQNKRGPMDAGTLATSLMALGNVQGGFLLLGVDNSGKVLGVHPQRNPTPRQLRDELKRKFLSPPQLSAHLYQELDKRVWCFHIAPAEQTPYQLADGTFKIRRQLSKKQGPENLPFLLSELPSWQAERGTHHDFSSAIQRDFTWNNRDLWLNPLALDALETRLSSGRINNPLLPVLSSQAACFEALGLMASVNGQKVATNAALVLFGRNAVLAERVPGHVTQFQHFGADGALAQNLFCGQNGLPHRALILLAPRIEELFAGTVTRRELMENPFRIDIPDYGDDALREATMNAFIHRDFQAREAVIIQLYPQRFFVSNPGGFYRDVTPRNLLFHEPCPRNRLLAQACADLGLVEKSGRGVDRIFWDQIRFFRSFPSYSDSTLETVRLTLQGGATSLEAVRWMLNHFQNVEELSVRLIHGAFLHQLFFEGELSRSELIASLPGLLEEVGRRAITELIDAGLISRVGHGRGQRLVLSPQLQSEMGQPGAFIHQMGMMDEHRRGMILSFVDAHGRITRTDAAKLLNVPADITLSRLLKNMDERGDLVQKGEGKTTHYVRP